MAAAGKHVKKEIHVMLSRNVVILKENDDTIHTFDCVTGKAGATGRGRFAITRKAHPHTSRAYGADMPYASFFIADGKAIHGSPFAAARGYLQWAGIADWGSHGCVGLSNDAAAIVFEWAPVGTPVIIA